jgi:hypothetical protein
MRGGTVVPRNFWGNTASDTESENVVQDLQMPIFFQHTDGRLGLSLEAALAGCHSL